MAESPLIRNIPRNKLLEVFKTQELAKLFEDVLYAVGTTLPGAADGIEVALNDHITATDNAHQASAIGNTPSGGITEANVQGALNGLEARKQDKDATLTAISGVTTATDKLIYWTGVDAASVCDFTAFARSMLAGATAGDVRSALGLGTLATQSGMFSGASSGTNTGDETAQRIGSLINGAAVKTTPVDADQLGLMDSAAGNVLKKLSWANVKATLKAYFDTLYQAAGSYLTSGGTNDIGTATGTSLKITGNLTTTGGLIGYEPGAGGTVVQATSKSTGVTLDKPSGQITMDAASLAANTTVSFTLTNSFISAADAVVCNRKSGGTDGAYRVWVDSATTGSCVICVENRTAGALAEAVVLSFSIFNGITS